MPGDPPTRDELAERYLNQLPYAPYPVQEEALLAWFTCEQGVLVCAPTGTGKTLIAEAALFEALHTGKVAYYTTPLIALTEQKFSEMQEAAVRWGFAPELVGLVTGNRKVNPQARVLVVVAEILLNRLLTPEGFDFSEVSAVVMDEFHSFADPERGIVWELTLSLLPSHVRLLLLSATVGNSTEFVNWLERSHQRKVELVEGTERRVPLTYQWVEDQLLNEQITLMAEGDDSARLTPALIFCFNRDECWEVAEQLKGKDLLSPGQQKQLVEELDRHDWSKGAGPKLRRLLCRGVGVHHAGMLPRYRRFVEDLYERKLLSVAVCTETLAAGINLPARSVVLSSLVKGPPGEQKVIDPSSAHQIFGRAGRPQFDTRGYVVVLAHEDDVRIHRWQVKYDEIPEDTKDLGLMRAKKALKKKKPTRRDNQTYWTEEQFEKLKKAPPTKLYSKGPLPWRLLAYLLKLSPDVDALRRVVRKRLMDEPRLKAAEKKLHDRLLTLHEGGYVTLSPEPPAKPDPHETAASGSGAQTAPAAPKAGSTAALLAQYVTPGLFTPPSQATSTADKSKPTGAKPGPGSAQPPAPPAAPEYHPLQAQPTDQLDRLLVFRSVNPLYGDFLLNFMAVANFDERLQMLESALEVPRNLWRYLRVPLPHDLPPGPLSAQLDPELIARGLVSSEVLSRDRNPSEEDVELPPPPPLAEKLRILFQADFPTVDDYSFNAIWAAGEILRQGGDFNKFVTSNDLVKQEGLLFRHLLRLILLCGEFSLVTPPGMDYRVWQGELWEIVDRLTATCRQIDPESTDKLIEEARAAGDVVAPGQFPAAL